MSLIEAYKKLHQDIFYCTQCETLGKEIHRVQPEWDESKKPKQIEKWGLIVSQAPGATERKKSDSKVISDGREKIPFSGRAGIQLKKWFEKEGIDYQPIFEHCLKTSLTKCYPGKSNGGDRKPGMKEIKLCEPFLRRQIQLVKPKIIIPVGKQAIDWFFPADKKKPMADKIGFLREWNGCRIVCLPHPSPISPIIRRKNIVEKISTAINIIQEQWKHYNRH